MSKNINKQCKVCGEETETCFNINFKAVPICECCADSIFLQQAAWYSKERLKREKSIS